MIPGVPSDSQVYLNGAFMAVGDAKVSVLDRGFIFGDGIYEVVPVYNGRPFRQEEHLDRLDRSLAALRIHSPFDRAGWRELVGQMVACAAHPTCVVYLHVTRGVAKRDHGFPRIAPQATVFSMTTPFVRPDAAAQARGYHTVSIDDERWLHCEIKSISLLGNVLAKQQAEEAAVDEVIQFRDGYLTEAAASNIWVVQDGKLLAPPKNNLILEGVRYGLMAELAAGAGVPFEMRRITRAEVDAADELLITSATKEVLPITQHDGRAVNGGLPGPVYAKLRKGYDERIAAL
jgi:D-alanine transaminase